MIIRELITRLGFTVDKAGQAKYEASVTRMRASAERLQNTLRGASGFLFMGYIAQQLGQKLIQTADQGLQLTNRLEGLKAASGQSAAGLGELLSIANKTFTPIEKATDVYASMYTALAPRGESIQNIKLFTQNLLTMLKAGGASQEVMNSAITQLGQSLNNGRLQGDELNSVLDASPMLINNIVKALSKKYKISVRDAREQIKKFGEDGKITLDVLTDALSDTGEAGLVMDRHVTTLAEAMTVLQNNIAYASYKSDTMKKVITALAQATMWLANHVEYVYGAFAAFGLLLGGSLLIWIARVTAALWAMGAAALSSAIRLALVAAPFILIGVLIGLVVLAIQDFYTWLKGGDSVFGDWVNDFSGSMGRANDRFVAMLNFFSDKMHEFTDYIITLLPSSFLTAFNAVRTIVTDFFSWLAGPLNTLSDKMHSITGAIGKAIATPPADTVQGGLASGGKFGSGSYLVGEKGPELATFGRSGFMLPNNVLSMLNSGLAGQTRRGDVNVNVALGGITVNGGGSQAEATKNGRAAGQEIVSVLREELRKTFVSTMANFPGTA